MSQNQPDDRPKDAVRSSTRRSLLERLGAWALVAGPLGGWGLFAGLASRSAWPEAEPPPGRWFVARLDALVPGQAVTWRRAGGAPVVVARRGDGSSAADFVALSDVCPHLGCRVRFDPARREYLCPCHQGRFDAEGRPLAGPPADAGTPLDRHPVVVERGALYLLLPRAEALR